LDTPVIAVVRASVLPDPCALVDAFVSAGVAAVEFTLTTPGALEAVAAGRGRGAAVGAGTVIDRYQATAALDAGAEFIVSPVLDEEVIGLAREAGVPSLPGAFTPNEVRRAAVAGAAFVKLFPARLAPPAYVRDLRSVMPEVRLVPSGGVDPGNAGDYMRAGVAAVSSGTATASPDLIAGEEYAEIARRARELVAAVRSAR
jgi:2-dehydro-3-deoxyphosphogluconate aldolase/(4S)-4-hydroxy-2-oxoglutarate aldolase